MKAEIRKRSTEAQRRSTAAQGQIQCLKEELKTMRENKEKLVSELVSDVATLNKNLAYEKGQTNKLNAQNNNLIRLHNNLNAYITRKDDEIRKLRDTIVLKDTVIEKMKKDVVEGNFLYNMESMYIIDYITVL